MNQKKPDMGSERIPKLLAMLAIPAVIAQIVNLLYNIVDRIYIGHIPEIGASALTGVGLFTPILMFLTAFAMLVGAGGAPRAAIAMGRKDKEAAEHILGNSFTAILGFAISLTVVFYFLAPQMLRLFGAWYESLHHYPGLCKDQHDDHHDRCSDQHRTGSHLYLCP